ncbi:hypothetical protein FA95DRAFT_1517415 [Auriscalpium vulgare]|uniref:Uncharacterized protein n=1 Tax=Auriscalpium vulgare TaxID=40419 RepID=A0ACB8RW95_9AGAM|nr:hypothetical protein FA95DRAFT_1517415 [Auriscalpium vulgare]
MSSLAFLVTELQSLASETRRKHPEVREAAEKSLAILRASPEQATANLASDGPHAEDLLRPVFMGCATKNAKVVGIALGSLQRLIALRAVSPSAVPVIVSTMADCMNQGVDIQLKILQTLLSLVTNFPAIHGKLLGDALLLCFKLQESRIGVVSSTAAATLRQLVMFVVDKVVEEDRSDNVPREDTRLPDGSTKPLGPAALDAFAIFQDLCMLGNGEKPLFLKLEYLHKTFALELIESVLTNYHDLFRKHTELLLLLQHHLCPLLLKSLSDRPIFPLTLRSTRVVFLLLKQFSSELLTESEVFMMLLIRIIGGDFDPSTGTHADSGPPRPPWMRVLAMEIMRGLCGDADFMRNIWQRYDAQQTDTGAKVFTQLIAALKRLVTAKPAILGVSHQMMGVGVPAAEGADGRVYGLDKGGVAGMVATAASATVSNVVGMIGSEAGLSTQGSAMKVQCIDQLDKADAPPIPEAYIYLLGVQCLVAICDGFATYTAPLYTSLMVQKPRAAGDAVVRAPAALDPNTLPSTEPAHASLLAVRAMISAGWPALLAALSFLISTNLSDELFVDVLAAHQALTNVAGMLALRTPRDAFLTALAKAAIPARVVSALDSYVEPATPRTPAFSEGLGLSGPAPGHAPGLSERNLACLKVLVTSALFLAGSLGESWFDVLEALQNADYVLTSKGQRGPKRGPPASGSARQVSQPGPASGPPPPGAGQARHPLLADLDTDSVQLAIQRLFDASKLLEDAAFKDFVDALCRLSAEMVGMQSIVLLDSASALDVEGGEDGEPTGSTTSLASPRTEYVNRRRVSGIHLPRTLRSGDFGINRLGGVAIQNIHRLIYRASDIAWDTITSHLLFVIRLSNAPQSIRLQAAHTLDEILIVVPRNLTTAGEQQAVVQRRVLDVLAQQIMLDPPSSSASVELRRMGLETLHQILQASGHTLVVGWETIFEILNSVCKPAGPVASASTESTSSALSSPASARPKPLPLGYSQERGYATLIKIAFQSLTLVCDSLSVLSPEHLRMCISTLGHFGLQADTNISLTAAESLFWSVSDSIQAKRKDAEKEPAYSALWMHLLLEILQLCTDARPEVRMGAIQTLFRTLQLYGATLSLETWDECVWKVTFPLLDALTAAVRHNAISPSPSLDPSSSAAAASPVSPRAEATSWDESKVVALQSVGAIFSDFLVSKIMHLASFGRVWETFVEHIRDAFLLDSRAISAPALRCLEKALRASVAAEAALVPATAVWERAWQAADEMGETVVRRANAAGGQAQLHVPFTQESLVAYVDVVRSIRTVSLAVENAEWPLDRIARLMSILKGKLARHWRVLTYPNSPDYRPDIDSLSPLQSVVLETVSSIDLSAPGVPSTILRDLSEYATLPFIAAFDAPDPNAPPAPAPSMLAVQISPARMSTASSKQKRVTYMALSKKTMPMLVELFLRFKDKEEIYVDETLEALLSAYSIPIKLKYDCPPSSKFVNDPPIWKTATTSFLRIVKEIASQIQSLGTKISPERVESIWRQTIDVFRGGILADCSAADTFPFEDQEAEENFDLQLIASLEIDVVPFLGDARVPDHLILQLAKVLQQGSQLREYEPDDDYAFTPITPMRPRENAWGGSADADGAYGSTAPAIAVSRERFSYWCFDLLFLICSDTSQDQEESRKRVAALCLSALLGRCRTTLAGYVADESLRGNLPFPRVREEELLYVLHKLQELRLWPGSLWAALSDSPTQYATHQPPVDTSLPPSALIADSAKRSTRGHLFHFYTVLAEIASVPRKAPSAWVVSDQLFADTDREDARGGSADAHAHAGSRIAAGGLAAGRITALDARALARECLKEVGRELGVPR